MSNSHPVQEIFRSDQYLWCHEGNENIANWLATNNKEYPRLYATYINDANAVIYRKRVGKPVEHDKRMLMFLERYPMTYTDVVDELTSYKAKILEQKDWSGVGPHMTGLVDVRTHGQLLTLRGVLILRFLRDKAKIYLANKLIQQETTPRSSLRPETSSTSRSSTTTHATTTGLSAASKASSTPMRSNHFPGNRRLTRRVRSAGPR
jgi:hypothetical protein